MTHQLNRLPPSALLVYRVLEEDAPLTQQELIEESRLCPRTARYALDRLDDVGLLEARPYPHDARQTWYDVDDT